MATPIWLVPDPNYYPRLPLSLDGENPIEIPWELPLRIRDVAEVIEEEGGYIYKAEIIGNTKPILGAFGARKYVVNAQELDKYLNSWTAGQEFPSFGVGYEFVVSSMSFVVLKMDRSDMHENAYISKVSPKFMDRFGTILGRNFPQGIHNQQIDILSKGIDLYAVEVGILTA